MDMLIEDCLWASSLAHTAYPEIATPPRKLLPVFPVWPLLNSKDHKAASKLQPSGRSTEQNTSCLYPQSSSEPPVLTYVIKNPKQMVPLVLLSRFEVRHNWKGTGSHDKTKPPRVFQGACWYLLSKGQSKRGQWGLEREIQPRQASVTHSPTSQLVLTVSAALRQWPLFLSGFVLNTLFWPAPSPQINSSSKFRRNTPGITGFFSPDRVINLLTHHY